MERATRGEFPGLRRSIQVQGWARAQRPADHRRRGWLLAAPSADESGAGRDPVLANVEAALLAADEPLSARRLARWAGLADADEAQREVTRLNQCYAHDQSAFRVHDVAGGFQMLSAPDLRPWIDAVLCDPQDLQLSGPALETLAVVAYWQPIGRADIEAIRGVGVAEILKQLLDKTLVRLVGKDDSLGRPYLYGTTRQFLEAFGLRNLGELPMVERLRRPAGAPGTPQTDSGSHEGDS